MQNHCLLLIYCVSGVVPQGAWLALCSFNTSYDVFFTGILSISYSMWSKWKRPEKYNEQKDCPDHLWTWSIKQTLSSGKYSFFIYDNLVAWSLGNLGGEWQIWCFLNGVQSTMIWSFGTLNMSPWLSRTQCLHSH